jgi:DmsE family decaheme c-type cytochrome
VKRRRAIPSFALAVLATGLLLAGGSAAGAPDPTPTPAAPPAAAPAPPAKAAASADTKCADCHGDIVEAFAKNPHARYSGKGKKPDPNDICSTCHGDGAKHMESGGDKTLISVPKGAVGAQDCLSCHENIPAFANGGTDSFSHGVQDSLTNSVHANSAAVNCLTCHSMHKSAPKSEHLLAAAPGELCATCHTTQSAAFANKPYVHRLDRGGMTCLDCHSPHARKGQTVKMTTQGELPCLNCHSEMRGPFVFQHVTGSGGDCLSCHQPHGSNNPNMLLWARVDQLCLSCHSQTGGPKTYGSQPPSFHDLTSPRYRNCTTCHVAVHGSNLSPGLLK